MAPKDLTSFYYTQSTTIAYTSFDQIFAQGPSASAHTHAIVVLTCTLLLAVIRTDSLKHIRIYSFFVTTTTVQAPHTHQLTAMMGFEPQQQQ